MSKIYISPETLDKLYSSSNKQKYADTLKVFDINNQESKGYQSKTSNQKLATKPRINSDNSEKELKKSLKQLKRVLRKIKQRHHKKLPVSAPPKAISPEKAKHSIANIADHRIHKQYNQPATIFYSPNSNKKTKKTTPYSKTTKDIYYLKKHHLLSGEYVSNSTNLKERYAELRAKNNAVLQRCKKTGRKSQKRDWTDRFALK